MTDWQEAEKSAGCNVMPTQYEFAQTEDPRVLAVIQRDWDASVSEQLDGDECAIYYREYRGGWRLYHQAGEVEDEIAAAYCNARDRFGYERYSYIQRKLVRTRWDDDEISARYMRIFHDTVVLSGITGGYDRSGDWVVFDTPAWRKRCGIEGGPSTEHIQGLADSLVQVLDGYVYGIGWATNEARRLPDDEPINLLDGDWEIDIQCWGFIGEDYAKESALAFEMGSPELPEMLEV